MLNNAVPKNGVIILFKNVILRTYAYRSYTQVSVVYLVRPIYTSRLLVSRSVSIIAVVNPNHRLERILQNQTGKNCTQKNCKKIKLLTRNKTIIEKI